MPADVTRPPCSPTYRRHPGSGEQRALGQPGAHPSPQIIVGSLGNHRARPSTLAVRRATDSSRWDLETPWGTAGKPPSDKRASICRRSASSERHEALHWTAARSSSRTMYPSSILAPSSRTEAAACVLNREDQARCHRVLAPGCATERARSRHSYCLSPACRCLVGP